MAKQLNVNLAFTADTNRAKQQIQDLQNQLSAVINMPTAGLGADMVTKINQASRAAAELKVHLEKATNVKTGNLDFTKLNQSIKNSGSSLSEYAAKLKEIGPQGQTAFNSLAQAVASAEVPIRRSNALLSELWVTMKNTMRWQLTSSMLHGFIGAVQSAVGYTKDLNESLNNIRIVTNQSVEQMAEFAKEANKAAKNLSTSTLNYTDAALIYYQQGLNDTQVKERTDITIKMANVSRQSAQEVSDQMTAVWNNFYDGSQSLEHFADVMTRLGADTASSSDEIAQGLEKFAAIADMIGLSFDNAAAALATVTATTRQSADVVGTAFKTIFARIQGLSLGETLDDGTNLNKYSQALDAVGINIKDQSGELKDMDSILEEMGAKWKTLSKDQQVALAQTVAGVRQYNQLIALMDNFDFYQKNLFSAQDSDGTLQEQADIYAESWQAASKRVRASWEDLWGSLIDDKAFISILNILSKIIDGFDAIIDSAGGLGGVISSLGLIFSQVFQKQILSSITNASYSLKSWTESGRESIRQEKSAEINRILSLQGEAPKNSVQDIQNQVIRAQLESQQRLIDNAKNLTDEEQKVYQILLDQQKVRGDLAVKAAQEVEQKKKQVNQQRFNLVSDQDEAKTALTKLEKLARKRAEYYDEDIGSLDPNGTKYQEIVNTNTAIGQHQKTLMKYFKSKDVTDFTESVTELAISEKKLGAATTEATKPIEISNQKTKENTQNTQNNTQAKNENRESSKGSGEAIDRETQERKKENDAIRESNGLLDENNNKKNQGKTALYAKNFLSGAQAAMGMISAVNALSSAYQTLNSDASATQKLVSITMSLNIAGGMLYSSLAKLNKITLSNGMSLGQMATQSKLLSGVIGKLGLSSAKAGVQIAALGVYAVAAVAAIIALSAIIKQSIDAWNDDANAVKGARESVKQATESFNEAKTSLDNLSGALKEYETLQHTFDNLTKGTKEWNEALVESNAHVSEMLRNYPELSKYFVNDNGKFSFSNTEEVKKLYEGRVNSTQSALNTSQIALNLAENRSMKTNALRDKEVADLFNGSNFANEVLRLTTQGAIAGAAVGAVGGPFAPITSTMGVIAGTITGAVTGLTSATIANTTASNESEKALNLLQKAYDESGSIIFTSQEEFTKALSGIGQDTIEALWNNREALEKLAVETNLNTAQMRALIESNISTRNVNNQYYQDLDDYDKSLTDTVVANRASKALADPNSAEYKAQRKKAEDKIFGGLRADNYNEYLQARFGDDWQNYRVTGAWGDDATLQKKNENGTWENVGQKNTLSNTEVLDFMTSHYLQEITSQDQATIEQLQKVEDAIRSGSYNGKNQFDDYDGDNSKILQLQKDLATDGVISLINFSPSEVAQIKESLSSIPAEYSDAIKKAVDDYSAENYANNVISQEHSKIQNIFANAATELKISDEALESYAASLMEADGKLKEFNEIVGDSAEETAELRAEYAKLMTAYAKASAAQYKLAKGLNQVQKAYEDNKDILEEGNEASLDFHEAVGALSEALTDAFGMEVDASFVKDNLKLIKEMANGSEDALVSLRKELNKDFIMSLNLETENAQQELINELNRMSEEALNADIETEITMDNSNAIAALNEALFTGQATIQDIEAMFNNANLAMPEYKTKKVPGDVTRSHSVVSGEIFGIPYQYETDMETTTERVIPYFGDIEPTVDEKTGEVTSYGGGKLSTTTTGDIGQLDKILDYEGKDNKKSGGKKYKPEENRYYEITKEIEKQERALKRLQKTKDSVYGANKLKAIDNEIAAIKKLKEATEELYRQQREKLEEDANALLSLFPDADITNGYIANYNELLLKTTSEEQKKILDQYASTWEAVETTYDKLVDFDNQIKDLNYEKIQYKLELKIDVEDAELKRLDYFLNKLSDDFYKMAESAALMMDKIKPTSNILSTYEENVKDLDKAFKNGDISQEKHIEGLKNIRDAIYEQLEALNELDKQMLHYYEDALSAATDELSDYTDHMEHLTSVLGHYQNILSLIGKSKDYEAMGNFLQGQVDTINDRLSVAQSYYGILLQQRDQAQAKLQKAIASGDKDLIERYRKELDAIIDETDAAQEQILSLTEELVETMKSVIQNNMEKIADTLEKTLTGGTTFDTLMDGLDKLNTRQEEYLTKTNQIYETNKLMRTANKALDETDNKVAKQKLKNFIDETKNLQKTTKLSKYELEIQQAKYDLLLAQIALEEARNAKSTVRLSRDNEGNFGYIYTADQNKISDAQQGVDDAENKLYNLSLEAQQKYTEKYLQAEQAMLEELKQLQQDYLDGNIASEEEYELRKSQILEHYLGPEGVLTTYSKLYNVAVQTDADATADYWGKDYGKMTQNTSDWKVAVDKYLEDIKVQTDSWKNVSVIANQNVKGALDDSAESTRILTDDSNALKNKLNDEVIPALGDELTAVSNVTTEFNNNRTALLGLIKKYEDYIKVLDEAIKKASKLASTNTGNTSSPPPPSTKKPSSPSGGSGNGSKNNGGTGGSNNKKTDIDNTIISPKEENNDPVPPKSAYNEGQRLKTKEKWGFISRYQKKDEAMLQDGAWGPAVGLGIKLNEITDKYYYNGQWYYKVKGGGAFGYAPGWIKGLQAEPYDTGGYTGNWGPEGKLAMLHQKELVLNAKDTENMLNIIAAVREIMNSIDKQATWASSGLGVLTSTTYNSVPQNLEQNVTIHAEFPNAINHSEIEEAFDTLINRASQYANRK